MTGPVGNARSRPRRVAATAMTFAIVFGLLASMPVVASAPSNDDFASATQLAGATGSIDGTNVDATEEAGEPTHDTTAIGAATAR